MVCISGCCLTACFVCLLIDCRSICIVYRPACPRVVCLYVCLVVRMLVCLIRIYEFISIRMTVCRSLCLYACVSPPISVRPCLPSCKNDRSFACPSISMFVRMPVCVCVCLSLYIYVCLTDCPPVRLPIALSDMTVS